MPHVDMINHAVELLISAVHRRIVYLITLPTFNKLMHCTSALYNILYVLEYSGEF